MYKIITTIFFLGFTVLSSCSSVPKKENGNTSENSTPLTSSDDEAIIPRKYQSIYIHNFNNNSFVADMTGRLKDHLNLRFSMDKTLKLESDKNQAHLFLYGDIDIFEKIPRSYNAMGEPDKFLLLIVVTIRIKPNEKLFKDDIYDKREVRYETYYSPQSPPYESESNAKDRLLKGLAERIHTAVIKGWYSELKSPRELGTPLSK